MKKVPRFIFSLLAAALLLLPFTSHAAPSWTTSQITTEEHQQNGPIISDNTIVWTDFRNGQNTDVWGYNLKTKQEFPIIQGPGHDQAAGLQGNHLLYNEYLSDTNTSNIWLLNLKNNKEQLIATGPGYLTATDIDKPWVVYTDGSGFGQLFAYNIDTHKRIAITDQAARPRVSDSKVVWYFNKGGGFYGVRGYNLKSKSFFELTNEDSGSSQTPDIDENTVVWAEDSGGHSVLMLKDLKKGRVSLVHNPDSQSVGYPTISDRYIAWQQFQTLFHDGETQAYAATQNVWVKDRKTGQVRQLSDDGPQQVSPSGIPSIFGKSITWFSWLTGNGDVYLAEHLKH